VIYYSGLTWSGQ